MSGARSRRAGRVQSGQRIQGQMVLIFLALGSIGSFLLGHEIAADLAVRAIYTTASQDHLTYSPIALRAGGALGASVSRGAPSRKTSGGSHRSSISHAHGSSPSDKGGQSQSGQNATSATPGAQTSRTSSSAGGATPGLPSNASDNSSSTQPDDTDAPSPTTTPSLAPVSPTAPSSDLALSGATNETPAAVANSAAPAGAGPR